MAYFRQNALHRLSFRVEITICFFSGFLRGARRGAAPVDELSLMIYGA